MRKVRSVTASMGCGAIVLAPVIGAVVYPRANWLFVIALIGIVLLVFLALTSEGPTPQEIADAAQRILEGNSHGWDIDDYEHANPKSSELRRLWPSTMAAGGLPEEWTRLDEAKKYKLREIILKIRQMPSSG